MNYENYLQVNSDDQTGILTIILDRKDNEKNQLDSNTIHALETVLAPQITSPTCRGVILASGKQKVFSTGADIEGDLLSVNQLDASRYCREGRRIFEMFSAVECPTVAAISGFALGGGCEIAMSCDFRIAAKNARIGLPEINLGIIPGWGGTQRLPRLIGRSRALKMILSGDPINAATALEYGLVDEVVENYEDLIPAAGKLLSRFTGKSKNAVSLAIRSVYKGRDMKLSDAMDLESDLFALAWSTTDREEGISAFLEKRRAKWPE